jgi:hypothetical protein
MAPLPLQGEHHCCEVFGTDFFSIPALADLKVLAEFAGKVAVRHEDRARSTTPDQLRFLTEMRAKACDLREGARPAEPGFTGGAVHMAGPGAHGTVLKKSRCL